MSAITLRCINELLIVAEHAIRRVQMLHRPNKLGTRMEETLRVLSQALADVQQCVFNELQALSDAGEEMR
jgi:hypothetical protein